MDALRERVRSLDWVHTIDLGGGLVTPGAWPVSPLIRTAFDTLDFRGKKVLDVGCWDGLWSFEAERRGAGEVIATDCVSQRPHREQPTFTLAHQILESRVRYYPDLSVYRIPELGVRDFDIVLFCGVYYHLRHPLLALARLREVMKEGATLVIEGEVVHDARGNFAEFFYRDSYRGDRSTWWVPSVYCLRQWVESSYFEIGQSWNVADDSLDRGPWPAVRTACKNLLRRRPRYSRCLLLAKAVTRRDPLYPYPDEDLAVHEAGGASGSGAAVSGGGASPSTVGGAICT